MTAHRRPPNWLARWVSVAAAVSVSLLGLVISFGGNRAAVAPKDAAQSAPIQAQGTRAVPTDPTVPGANRTLATPPSASPLNPNILIAPLAVDKQAKAIAPAKPLPSAPAVTAGTNQTVNLVVQATQRPVARPDHAEHDAKHDANPGSGRGDQLGQTDDSYPESIRF